MRGEGQRREERTERKTDMRGEGQRSGKRTKRKTDMRGEGQRSEERTGRKTDMRQEGQINGEMTERKTNMRGKGQREDINKMIKINTYLLPRRIFFKGMTYCTSSSINEYIPISLHVFCVEFCLVGFVRCILSFQHVALSW